MVLFELMTLGDALDYWKASTNSYTQFLRNDRQQISDFDAVPWVNAGMGLSPYSAELTNLVEKCMEPSVNKRINVSQLQQPTRAEMAKWDGMWTKDCERESDYEEHGVKLPKLFWRENDTNHMSEGNELFPQTWHQFEHMKRYNVYHPEWPSLQPPFEKGEKISATWQEQGAETHHEAWQMKLAQAEDAFPNNFNMNSKRDRILPWGSSPSEAYDSSPDSSPSPPPTDRPGPDNNEQPLGRKLKVTLRVGGQNQQEPANTTLRQSSQQSNAPRSTNSGARPPVSTISSDKSQDQGHLVTQGSVNGLVEQAAAALDLWGRQQPLQYQQPSPSPLPPFLPSPPPPPPPPPRRTPSQEQLPRPRPGHINSTQTIEAEEDGKVASAQAGTILRTSGNGPLRTPPPVQLPQKRKAPTTEHDDEPDSPGLYQHLTRKLRNRTVSYDILRPGRRAPPQRPTTRRRQPKPPGGGRTRKGSSKPTTKSKGRVAKKVKGRKGEKSITKPRSLRLSQISDLTSPLSPLPSRALSYRPSPPLINRNDPPVIPRELWAPRFLQAHERAAQGTIPRLPPDVDPTDESFHWRPWSEVEGLVGIFSAS